MELTAMGLALGGNARVGLEDTLYLRKGELAPSNLALVSRTIRLAESLGPADRLGRRSRGGAAAARHVLRGARLCPPKSRTPAVVASR